MPNHRVTLNAAQTKHRSSIWTPASFIVSVSFIVRSLILPSVIFTALDVHASAPEQRALEWSDTERAIIRSFSLRHIEKPPPLNPSNRYGNNVVAKKMGERLFADPKLSGSKKLACIHCHQIELNFTDGQTTATGASKLNRNTPSLLGSAYQTWFYADGRRDSLWAQAITPLEARDEMGSTRVAVIRYILSETEYTKNYEKIFGPLTLDLNQLPSDAGPYGNKRARKNWRYMSPNLKHQTNHVFANIGRVFAAYQRDLNPKSGKLEKFSDSLDRQHPLSVDQQKDQDKASNFETLSLKEQQGLKLFIDNRKTQCLNCHNGPLLTNGEFHNIGTATLTGRQLDLGRMIGLQAVLADEFNCFGAYSGVRQNQCDALRFVNTRDSHSPSLGAYKVPSLRGIAKTAPYGHHGKFETLTSLMEHYRNPPDKAKYNHEILPLDLNDKEIERLVAFLKVL